MSYTYQFSNGRELGATRLPEGLETERVMGISSGIAPMSASCAPGDLPWSWALHELGWACQARGGEYTHVHTSTPHLHASLNLTRTAPVFKKANITNAH